MQKGSENIFVNIVTSRVIGREKSLKKHILYRTVQELQLYISNIDFQEILISLHQHSKSSCLKNLRISDSLLINAISSEYNF